MSLAVTDKTVARCTRCGREFVYLPDGHPLIDTLPPADWRPPSRKGDWQAPQCGGNLELTAEGLVDNT